jgi:hypothetical protein
MWAALSAGGIASFPVLPGIETLTIFGDADPTGLAAAQECQARWRAAGRECPIVLPPHDGTDWNNGGPHEPTTEDPDVFMREGRTYNGNGATGRQSAAALHPRSVQEPHAWQCAALPQSSTFFPRVGLILVWGPPKCGKSFWTFDTVMHIALGWPLPALTA